MGTTNGFFSGELVLKEDPGTEGHDLKPEKQENRSCTSHNEAFSELDRRQNLEIEQLISSSDKLKDAQLNVDAGGSLEDREIQTPNEATPDFQHKVNSECGIHEPQLHQFSNTLANDMDKLNQEQKNDAGQCPLVAGKETIPDTDSCTTPSNQTPVVVKQEANVPRPRNSLQSKEYDSHFVQVALVPRKESDLLKLSEIPDNGIHASASSMEQKVENDIGVSQFGQVCLAPSKEKDSSEKKQHLENAIVPNVSHTINTGVFGSSPDQQIVAQSARPDKALYKLQPRRNLDGGGHPLRSVPESISSVSAGKATDDGYNWRKYGQKFVKGNVFIRSYYKCTYSNCRAKRQVERSHDGPITDIKYIGTHEHPKPYNPQSSAFASPLQETVEALSVASKSTAEDEAITHVDKSHSVEPPLTPRQGLAISNADHEGCQDSQLHNLQGNDDSGGCPNLKKQKRETLCVDDNYVRKTYCESRHVVKTVSEVDLVNDGYRWRKYGQKLVKGNPNPRSYYRCTNAGCQAKKHVERASHDAKMVITTYEGVHDHDTPASGNVSQSASSGNNCTTMSSESRSELGDHKLVALEKAVDIGIQTD